MSDPPLRLRERNLDWRTVGEDTVVLDLDGSEYISINASATVLWPLLAAGATRASLAAALTDRFGLDKETADRDVDAFVAWLRARGLLDCSGV